MPIVLLETLRYSDEETKTVWIPHPEKIIRTHQLSEVPATIQQVQGAVSEGYFAAGFVSYEAGNAFVPHMGSFPDTEFPLVWFALTLRPQIIERGMLPEGFGTEEKIQVTDLQLDTSLEEYSRQIESIRGHIEKGDTYQVNFTMRYRGNLLGSPRALYRKMRSRQRVPYAAYVEGEDWVVISLSPELFFRKQRDAIFMRPMKGTAPRGKTLEEDQRMAMRLASSEKERAENLMIVDLLRSDMGKICVPGSITVTQPLQIERYETLLQMTSAMKGVAQENLSIPDVFKAAFPSGSVTGAPKVRTMQIIRSLEKSPRRIYTGAIGFISTEETAFSVAIRTAIIEKGKIEMGVGSGILYEADAVREYRECELKGQFLTEPARTFQLIETILRQKGEFQHLELHLERLLKSAEYFMIPLTRERITQTLEQNTPEASGTARVRLLADWQENLQISTTELEPVESIRIRWSEKSVNSNDIFLYHKTTLRALYEEELRKAREDGFIDVLFQNERGEVTEGTFSNIWILKDGAYFTPPVSCGLLAGTYRRFLFETRALPVEERILRKEDVETADAVFISNAIRGLFRVTF